MSITNQKLSELHKAYEDVMTKNITNTNTPSLAEVVRNACAQIKEKKVPSKIEIPSDNEILSAFQSVLNDIEKQEAQSPDLKQITTHQWGTLVEEKAYSSNLSDSFVSTKKEKWEKDRALFSRRFKSKPKRTQTNIESAIGLLIRECKAFTYKQYMYIKYLHQNHYHESLLPEEIIKIITWKGESLNVQQKLNELEKHLQINEKDFANGISFLSQSEDMKKKALLEQRLKDLDF